MPEPSQLSDSEIQALVERFFDERRLDESFGRLKEAGARVVPYALAALNDPRTQTHAWNPDDITRFYSALNRICWLLTGIWPAEAVAPLTRFTGHPNKFFRRDAACALAAIATADCAEGVARALADPEEHVQWTTLQAINRTLDEKRGHPAFFAALFTALSGSLTRDRLHENAPELLRRLDPGGASAVLLSPECLSPGNPNLRNILQALNFYGQAIPHDILLPLMLRLEEEALDPEFGQALIAYSQNPDSETDSRLRSCVRSSRYWVAEAAGRALVILHGIGGLWNSIDATADKGGFDALTEPQKNFYAVWMAHADINNGGFYQYFHNSWSDYHGRTIAWMQAHEAAQRAAILEESGTVFGPAGPPTDLTTRRPIAYNFSPGQDAFLDGLNERYYACQENVEALLWLYATDHKDAFRPANPE